MDWMQDNVWAFWLALAMVLGVAEMLSLELVLLMLAVGALGGMVTALLGAGLVAQALVAAGAAVAMLAFVRPTVVRRLHSGPDLRQGIEALVGIEGYALADVSDTGGQVKLGGEVWTARPYEEGVVIPQGARVQVLQIQGATALVHEVPSLGT